MKSLLNSFLVFTRSHRQLFSVSHKLTQTLIGGVWEVGKSLIKMRFEKGDNKIFETKAEKSDKKRREK
jgi:hypothetical protein